MTDSIFIIGKFFLPILIAVLSVISLLIFPRIKNSSSNMRKFAFIYIPLGLGMIISMKVPDFFIKPSVTNSDSTLPTTNTTTNSNVIIESILIDNQQVKSGYYLAYDNQYRLNINSISQYNVVASLDNLHDKPKTVNLEPGQTYLHRVNADLLYRIRLNSISNSKVNVLGKTAYFTITKSRESSRGSESQLKSTGNL